MKVKLNVSVNVEVKVEEIVNLKIKGKCNSLDRCNGEGKG